MISGYAVLCCVLPSVGANPDALCRLLVSNGLRENQQTAQLGTPLLRVGLSCWVTAVKERVPVGWEGSGLVRRMSFTVDEEKRLNITVSLG